MHAGTLNSQPLVLVKLEIKTVAPLFGPPRAAKLTHELAVVRSACETKESQED
jgi:hypothetical protein